MPKTLVKLRQKAFARQDGRCFYCSSPMFEGDAEEFTRRLRAPAGLAKHLKCTAEHLQAVKDGGKNVAANIVAACLFCNSRRHQRKCPPEPQHYKRFVEARIRRGKWHPKELLRFVRSWPDTIERGD